MKRHATTLALVACLAASCAAPSTRNAGTPATPVQPPSRPTERPPPAADAPFAPPEIVERRLSNGIRLLMVERRDLPLLVIEVVIKRGAADADPAIASFAAELLERHARRRRLPIPFVSTTFDATTLRGGSVTRWWSSSNLSSEAFAGMARLLRAPELTEDTFLRERERRLARTSDELDPWLALDRATRRALYPATHPYRAGIEGESEAAAGATLDAVGLFLSNGVAPDDVVVVAAGDVARESFFDSVREAFGSWQGRASARAPLADATGPLAGAPVVVIDEPGFARAHVRVAARAARLGDPDAAPLVVLNAALGNPFVGRLSLNLREHKAASYGGYSQVWAGRSNGLFEAWTTVERARTVEALTEMDKEIRRLRDELMAAGELAELKRSLVRKLPMRFATLDSTIDALEWLGTYDLPTDEFVRERARLEAVTSADVRRVARAYLAPDAVRWFVVTDSAEVRQALLASPFRDFAEVSRRIPVVRMK